MSDIIWYYIIRYSFLADIGHISTSRNWTVLVFSVWEKGANYLHSSTDRRLSVTVWLRSKATFALLFSSIVHFHRWSGWLQWEWPPKHAGEKRKHSVFLTLIHGSHLPSAAPPKHTSFAARVCFGQTTLDTESFLTLKGEEPLTGLLWNTFLS